MKKRISILALAFIMAFTVGGPLSKPAQAKGLFDGEIYINQEFINLYYDENGDIAGTEATGIAPWQFVLTEENPNWVAFNDVELKSKQINWALKESNYTFWGYSVEYKDNTYEFFNETSFTYESLRELEISRGKEINQIHTLYGDTGSVTLNYNLVDMNGDSSLLMSQYSYGKFAIDYAGTYKIKVDGQQAELNNIVDDYIVVSIDHDTPIKYEENKDKVVTVNLRLPVYTLNFQDENGTTLRDTVKIPAVLHQAFKYIAPKIDGYKVKVNEIINSDYDKLDKEFTIIYSKEPVKDGLVNVHYVDEQGNELANSVQLKGNVGETYNVEKKAINGYTLNKVNGELQGKFVEADQVVTLVYKKNANPQITGIVRIDHQDVNGKALSTTEMISGKLGEEYTTVAKSFDGYKLKNINGDAKGIYTKEDKRVVYVYEKESGKTTNDKSTPKTGVETNVAISAGLMLIASGLIVITYVAKKLKKEEK